MIARAWKAPNFRVVARDLDGKRLTPFVTYADSEEQLRTRLGRMGLSTESLERYRFGTWLKKAQKTLDKLKAASGVKERKGILRTSPHWQELKRHLFDLFQGRCAYCEGKPLVDSSGDVEHYRPKLGVLEEAGHGGYWWLAYSPQNLLPACENCNRVRGKRTSFPVEGGTRAWDDQGLATEQPLLLNPYEEGFDIRQHVTFIEGRAEGISRRGLRSVATYNLNRPGLGEERRQRQKDTIQSWLVLSQTRGSFVEGKKVVVEKILNGDRPYPTAALDALERKIQEEIGAFLGDAA